MNKRLKSVFNYLAHDKERTPKIYLYRKEFCKITRAIMQQTNLNNFSSVYQIVLKLNENFAVRLTRTRTNTTFRKFARPYAREITIETNIF